MCGTCKCLQAGMLLIQHKRSLYQGCGVFYRSNVERMMGRIIGEAPQVKLEPYKFSKISAAGPVTVELPPVVEELEVDVRELEQRTDEAYERLKAAEEEYMRLHRMLVVYRRMG